MQHLTLKCCLQMVDLVEYHLNLHFVATLQCIKQYFPSEETENLPTLIDACVKSWTIPWKKYAFKNLNMRNNVLFAILSCETGKKQARKFSRKSSYSATLTVILG